jgi:nucleoside-diphosphate-sugar epimerase
MNILITGNLFSIATSLAKRLAKEKHRVILAAEGSKDLGIEINNVIVHSLSPSEMLFQDALSSYKFDVVIYIATREEQLRGDNELTGQQLDGLKNVLGLCKKENVKRFVYISSTEIYGVMNDSSEGILPQPASINGYTLLAGEQYCKLYFDEFGLPAVIVRVPYVYGDNEKTSYVYRLIQDCKNQNNVVMPGDVYRDCSFLHVDDVSDFLVRILDEEYTSSALVVNLSPSTTIKNIRIAELLQKHFPLVNFTFDEDHKVFTRPVTVSIAKKIFDWIDLHNVDSELAEYINSLVDKSDVSVPLGFRGILKKLFDYAGILKWVELILGAGLTQYLSQLTGTLIQYKYIDFRLLFVIMMASLYGFRFGILAAFLVSLSLFYTWYQLAIDWTLLIYNVGNWFPLALYFVTGLFFGYSHDRNDTLIANVKNQTALIYEKYEFLYEVFNEIRKLKDEFREQVIGYRDSFGKIYTITRELDTLQEHAVYFRALTILEDLMENNNIAIYSMDPDSVYARLEVNSISLADKLAKSLKLSDYPEAIKTIEQGAIFQNTLLLPNYPAYIAPVLNYSYPFNVPVAIVVIWSVKFEQYSTYYYNLFKVISGLIQASLVRATKFLDANYERMYIPSTRILNSDAFVEILKTRAEMRKNGVAEYQLIMIDKISLDFRELYSKVSEGIRAADIVGLQNDGNCYVLLSQADLVAANAIIDRLNTIGLKSKLVNIHELQLD